MEVIIMGITKFIDKDYLAELEKQEGYDPMDEEL